MDIAVAALEPGDRDQWESLFNSYADFYKMPMSAETRDRVWAWIASGEMKFFGIMAKDSQGKALGFMHFREMPSPLRGSMVGFLDDLYVCPAARGEGVVDALFDGLNETAAAQGWPFVRWVTAENNYRGRGPYDRLAEKTHWVTYQKDTTL
ncbi:GNAT family N-acetyltransferase [Marinobacterium rhizophilum]|uniref:GNAT family N-acetyltransferase n=1 Tax=Marinobacterium rhizophilum TaxID=420402 RepID=A0ABY5HH22_9GAMM|nr:GNAT family N-acetyltransferase [Marinobacterium rhizophilum]UTW11670.1 GNAT family N-acetyltransferase [Marinobacterium rhizophilum]